MSSRHNAFDRLQRLLADVPVPLGVDPIPLHLGESRLGNPSPLEAVNVCTPDITRYPPLGGTSELRESYRGWLARRYRLERSLIDGLAIEPSPGSKQALAVCIAQAVTRCRARGVTTPKVLLPNPFYPTYLAATEAASATPLYYLTGAADTASVVTTCLRQAAPEVAAIVACNPGNPGGDLLDCGALNAIGDVAAAVQATLLVDECYSDLYMDAPPVGYLSLVASRDSSDGCYAVMHSLSKRSAAPGLRSGFVTGDTQTVSSYANYNRSCGVSLSWAVCAASAALWADEKHVIRQREALAYNWELADRLLHDVHGYWRSPAGFFVWLAVDDGEATARRLWGLSGLRVMPGRYLSADDINGVNPGSGYVRIALVHQPDMMRDALLRLRAALLSQI